jgi:hypothetical protein
MLIHKLKNFSTNKKEAYKMDNQHQKITGYRELTQEEIDLMNEVKQLAAKTGELIEKLSASDVITTPDVDGIDLRWVNIAKTQLQQGFMALTRSIAKPTTF